MITIFRKKDLNVHVKKMKYIQYLYLLNRIHYTQLNYRPFSFSLSPVKKGEMDKERNDWEKIITNWN